MLRLSQWAQRRAVNRGQEFTGPAASLVVAIVPDRSWPLIGLAEWVQELVLLGSSYSGATFRVRRGIVNVWLAAIRPHRPGTLRPKGFNPGEPARSLGTPRSVASGKPRAY
jgi:hypothetical protein